MILTALMALSVVCGHAGAPTLDFDRTVLAIWMVESGGRLHPERGDSGRARGPYQIWESYWRDGTRILRVDWPYSDADNWDRATAVVCAYLRHYQRALGYPATPETWARLHNGGPRGPEKPATLSYWKRCQRHYQ